jgi:hypothetical protein
VSLLYIYSNAIGPEGGGALADALKSNTTLSSLNLRNNGKRPNPTPRSMLHAALCTLLAYDEHIQYTLVGN